MRYAERYKELMAAIAAKYTTNLGQSSIDWNMAFAEDMKRVLKKKEEEL